MEVDAVGKDFDQWLDWTGNESATLDPSLLSTSLEEAGSGSSSSTLFPVSPSSSAHGDLRPSTSKPSAYTAPNLPDLPTPEHSSSSPEVIHSRLSGDTLREHPVIASRPLLKRKLSPDDVPTLVDPDAKPPVKKRPHNVIEKRYRANLNERITELRDSVPSLRTVKKAQAGGDAGSSDNEDLDGLTPSNKLNKASILTKAVEYIKHLELRNKRLDDENKSLKTRLQTLDKVLEQGGDVDQRLAAFTSQEIIEKEDSADTKTPQSLNEDGKPSEHPSQGMIPLPESWKKFRESQPQEHYGHIYDVPSESSRLRGKWPARIMLGSLAGLMILEGFSESDHGTTSKEKGLFGIPLELLDGYRFLRSPRVYLRAFAQFCQHGGIIPLLKGFMALTILAFFIFAYLFNSKPPTPKREKGQAPEAPEESSLTSPIEVRRRAWSTSMQVLGLPHHHFFREWMAVTTEWLKYTVRYLFGAQAYAWVTGRSGDDEIARVKAWDIAIDAQLAGGDPEISRSRVVLTSFGSGTLPRTPLRLMLKSLHCRVLLWQVGGQSNSTAARIANFVAVYFANREWRRARQLQDAALNRRIDRLPPYLAALLEQECNDVFTDAVVQRAYNLMYDRPTNEDAESPLMDVIVEDHAVRSPLDAVAAWWSTQTLEKALTCSIENSQHGTTREYLQHALLVAPPGSAAQTRALALHAVFYPANRSEYMLRASTALPCPSMSPLSGFSGPHFIDSSTPPSARTEISNLLYCAAHLANVEQQQMSHQRISNPTTVSSPTNPTFDVNSMTLLTFSALHFVIRELQAHNIQRCPTGGPNNISILAKTMCAWLSTDHGDVARVPLDVISQVEHLCSELTGSDIGGCCKRRLSDLSHDTGYASQEDSEEDEEDSHTPTSWGRVALLKSHDFGFPNMGMEYFV